MYEAASRVERHFRDVQVFPQMEALRRPLCGLRAELEQDCLSRAPPVLPRRSALSFSGFCSFDALVCLSL